MLTSYYLTQFLKACLIYLQATSTNCSTYSGLLTARLSEVDYLGSEDSPVLNIAVSVDGSHSQPVTLQIIPLTFSMYQTLIDQSPDLICQIPLPNGENEAESEIYKCTFTKSLCYSFCRPCVLLKLPPYIKKKKLHSADVLNCMLL